MSRRDDPTGTASGTAAGRYLANAGALLEDIAASQAAQIELAATWVSETLERDGLIFVAGTGHSHMLAEELFYRAGGLAAVAPLLEQSLMLHDGAIKSTALERLEGYAAIVLEDAGATARDLLVIASNSGRNAYPVELALEAGARGCRTIAVTSLATAERVTSRHGSGKLLADVADLVLDNRVPYGDASVDIAGHHARMGPLSTIAGVALLNAVVVRAVEMLAARGVSPDTLVSANVRSEDRTGATDMNSWRKRVGNL